MKRKTVVVIDEPRCIGCARCLDACPVDAIVGAQGLMHTVVEPWCIGCDLCVPACPVDCIEVAAPRAPWSEAERRAAGERGKRRQRRLAAEKVSSYRGDRKALLDALLRGKR
ncbi:MAG TPA: RnfABCDGE type electron transport complex subunit B [Burkholderiales bacterium]|jgi:electron transport complex protein RnfB|nr:RnfABCDGE type electron transport complex subunit B [Burkholderiales bacterium]